MSDQPPSGYQPGQYPGQQPQWPTERQPWPGQPQQWSGEYRSQGEQARYQVRPDQQGQADNAWNALPVPYAQPAPAQGYGYAQPMPYHTVAPRSAGIAVLASFFLPGLGSMINGKVGKGLLILGCYIVSAILCLFVVGFVLAPACWIWGMVAGAGDANRWNRANGILS